MMWVGRNGAVRHVLYGFYPEQIRSAVGRPIDKRSLAQRRGTGSTIDQVLMELSGRLGTPLV